MADFPTQESLNALYGEWNPASYLRGFQNQELADQFREQSYQQQINTTRKGQLDNDFAEQDNPNRVTERVLTNRGRELNNTNQGIVNEIAGLGLERAKARQPSLLSEDQRAAVLKASDDDVKAFDYHVQELLRDPSPAKRQEGARLQTYLSSFQAERRKAQDDLNKAAVGPNIQREINKDNLAGGKYVRSNKYGLSLEQKIDSENDPAKKMALLIDASNQASQAGDEETANLYLQRAQALDNLVKLRSQGAVPKAGGLDIGGVTQLPTNPSPSAMPAPAPNMGTTKSGVKFKIINN